MSGGHIHRGVYVECDAKGCVEFIDGYGSFQELWNSLDAVGWTSRKVDDEWFNYCPVHSPAPDNFKPNIKRLLGDK